MIHPKPNHIISKKYLAFIRTLPCSVCGEQSEPHHVHAGGMGMKCNDTRTVPLCRKCHQEHDNKGSETFQRAHNIDFKDIMLRCLEVYIVTIGS